MLHLFQSNRLEILADHLAELLREQPLPPLQQEQIVVQHPGMGRWLSLQLADHLGVCANINFPLPAGFIWQMLGELLPDVPLSNGYDPKLMVWRVLSLLSELRESPELKSVAHYLDTQDEYGHYELAEQVARCLDAYLVYRPDWIARWERGENAVSGDEWQALIWRELADSLEGDHWVSLQKRLLRAHDLGKLSSEHLPPRAVLFGVGALSPGFLSIVELLAQHTEVYLLVLNPCRDYWLDIQDRTQISKKIAESRTDEDLYLEVGNPLLASWGKQGRDFLAQILAIDPGGEERYAATAPDTLLQAIQQGVLDLEEPVGHFQLSDHDDSLHIHSCHSAMREVEVLRDQLWGMFDRHNDLQPDEILVMTPDMDLYAPYIEAVFGRAEHERYIPFTLSDRTALANRGVGSAFIDLLGLPGSRYENNSLLALLEVPEIANRFSLAPDDLPQIAQWIEQAGVRWGRDGAMRAELGLPATEQNSWRFGIDRLLLGYALPGQGEQLFDGVLPTADIEGSTAAMLGGLSEFVEQVFALEASLSGKRTLQEWGKVLRTLLGRFFQADEQEQADLQQLRALIDEMQRQAVAAYFDQPVSLNLVRPWLRSQLEGAVDQHRFLGGGVSFCALTPMRSIPFKVICLLGMNDGSFPRDQRLAGFDLLASDHRLGDRSRRADDRYLFLETLISARQSLYLSYTGRDLQDNTPLPPSTLVNELLDNIKQLVNGGNESYILDKISTVHPLQPFSPSYFNHAGRLFSYSVEMAENAQVLATGESRETPFFSEVSLPVPGDEWRQITLDQLLSCFDNPARYLLRERLGVQLESVASELQSRDPMQLDRFASEKLQHRMIDQLVAEEGTEDLLARTRAVGQLPHGGYGEHYFDQLEQKATRFISSLDRAPLTQAGSDLEIDLHIGAFRLTGKLYGVGSHGVFDYHVNRLPARDQLRLWIRHLLLNLVAPERINPATEIYHGDQHWYFSPVADAEARLESLLEIYWNGLCNPLHFFPKSSMEYASRLADGKEAEKALEHATAKWQGAGYPESANAYYRYAFRGQHVLDEQFESLSRIVFEPLFSQREVR